jgi:hypothetical protein
MPHLVLEGRLELQRGPLEPAVHRWGRAVLKTADCWLHAEERAMLVEGVVVEFSRPLHPVAVVTHHQEDTVVRLWSLAPVERTRAVQRWLCVVAAALQQRGAGRVRVTNVPHELWQGLDLEVAEELESSLNGE